MSTHPYVSEWRESRLPEWRETDMAEHITLEAPELRPCNQVAAVPTSTGLLIGCNYRRTIARVRDRLRELGAPMVRAIRPEDGA